MSNSLRIFLTILLVELFVLLLRFFWALRRYIFMRCVEKKWLKYQKMANADYTDPLVQWLEGKTVIVKRYLKEAEIVEFHLPVVEPVGYSQIMSVNVSVWDTWLKKRNDFQSAFLGSLYQAIGYYRHACIETILPWFWLEFIIFFPRELSKFLGIPAKHWGSGLVDFIYKACFAVSGLWSLYSLIFK